MVHIENGNDLHIAGGNEITHIGSLKATTSVGIFSVFKLFSIKFSLNFLTGVITNKGLFLYDVSYKWGKQT